ncbi:MAG TPA: extracellular solute-binding protein [Nevskiales bacterium]|nr:extracellular solute-binding protein [Nevskiales bacterium]
MRRLCALFLLVFCPQVFAAELVVYSARNEQLIQPLFERYEKETGTRIKFLTDKEAPLLARLQAEGRNTPADILITVDAGNLWQAANLGLLKPLDSRVLAENIPAHLRDPLNRWYGLSVRARTIVYASDRVKPAELSTYEALAEPKWRGRLCLRTAKKVYNQSLVAMLIEQHGEARAEAIVRGWVANLAADPFASDNEVMDAIAAGRCDLGLVNTYYFGRLLRDKPQLKLALFWPNQGEGERGVHVNVSGAGVIVHSRRAQAAQAFLEWLSAGEAQAQFAAANLEFPANPKVAPDPAVAAWGSFRQNPINVFRAGSRQADATRLMDRAGYK